MTALALAAVVALFVCVATGAGLTWTLADR